jgi:AcrR family transcriptional regulator
MPIEFSGRGDPKISIQLLWERRKPPRRGPKPALSVDRVVSAAIAVADAEGLEALSMRRVAEQLGVGTMSLYRHVPAKGELLDLMFDRALGELRPIDPSAGDWRARLEHHARETMALYRRHPWALQVSVTRPPLGPNTIGSFDAMLGAVRGIGLNPAEMVAAVTLVGSYARGAARSVVESAQAERVTGESDAAWWGARQVFWEEFYDAERFPALTEVFESGGYENPIDAFEFGLARVLDGIESYCAKRSGSKGAGSSSGGSPV